MIDSEKLYSIVDSCDNLEDFQTEIMPYLEDFKMQWVEKITELVEQSGMTKSDFAHQCGVSRQSLHKWTHGAIPKSREDYIRIGFAAGLSLSEMDSFLKRFGRYSGLYPKSMEDSACIFVLNSPDIPHTFHSWESILKNIRSELEQSTLMGRETTMGTVTVHSNLLRLHNEEELIRFILNNVNSYQKKYYRLFDSIEAYILANSMDLVTNKPLSLHFLSDEQNWSSSLRQTVYQIRQKTWFPLRKKLIVLGLYLNMTVDQINDTLELAQMEPLSITNPTECALIFAVTDAELNDKICLDGGTELVEYVKQVLQTLHIGDAEDMFSDSFS